MKGFMNPIFHPVDDDIIVEERRTLQMSLSKFNQNVELPKQYERIFSSITDSSQQLNDSLLQPFDNSKYEQTLLFQNNNCHQMDHQVSQKNQRPIVKFDKNRLEQILQILANYQQHKQKPQKEQIINQNNTSKNIKVSSETKHFQFNKMKNIIKNDSNPQNQSPSNQYQNDINSHKQRSSTNYTPRVETSSITICNHSSKNLDANIKQKQDDTNIIQVLQKRTKSQYHPKQLILSQINDINQKIIQLKNLIIKSIKYDPKLESIQTSINKIIQQNEDSNFLEKEIVYLKDFTNLKSFKEQKYQIYFNFQKLISLAREKQKKLSIIMIFKKEGTSQDGHQSPKTNCILSRQTTSDNITEEVLLDDKKRFFQLVVNRKLELPYNHPNKDVLLNELYEKAIKMGIKKFDWQQFIINELKF